MVWDWFKMECEQEWSVLYWIHARTNYRVNQAQFGCIGSENIANFAICEGCKLSNQCFAIIFSSFAFVNRDWQWLDQWLGALPHLGWNSGASVSFANKQKCQYSWSACIDSKWTSFEASRKIWPECSYFGWIIKRSNCVCIFHQIMGWNIVH